MIEWFAIILFTFSFCFLAWRRLSWAVALALFLTPAYQLRFTIGFLPSTYLEVMLVAVVLAFALQKTVRHEWKTVQWPWEWLTASFVIAGIVAVVVSPDTQGALGLWKAYILEPVLFFYVFVNVIQTARQRRLALFALGALVVMVGFGALLQYAGLVPGVEPYASETPMRATSVFPFPTAIGKLVGPLVALFLGIILVKGRTSPSALRPQAEGEDKGGQGTSGEMRGRSLWQIADGKWFTLGVVAFGLIGLILSVSRGALIGVVGAVVFISFFSKWKKWIWALCVVGVLVVLVVPSLRSELVSVVTGSDVSTDVRLVMWKGTLRLLQDRPIFGAGLAGFPIVYADYKEASHTEFFPNPDHLILTLWVEMGLLGLIVFTWIIVRYFVLGLKKLSAMRHTLLAHSTWQIAYGSEYALTVGLLAAMVAFIVYGFFDTPYFKNDLAVVFWALLGLLVSTRNQNFLKTTHQKE